MPRASAAIRCTNAVRCSRRQRRLVRDAIVGVLQRLGENEKARPRVLCVEGALDQAGLDRELVRRELRVLSHLVGRHPRFASAGLEVDHDDALRVTLGERHFLTATGRIHLDPVDRSTEDGAPSRRRLSVARSFTPPHTRLDLGIVGQFDGQLEARFGSDGLALLALEPIKVDVQSSNQALRPRVFLAFEPRRLELQLAPSLIDDPLQIIDGAARSLFHSRVQDRSQPGRERSRVAAEGADRPVEAACLEPLEPRRRHAHRCTIQIVQGPVAGRRGHAVPLLRTRTGDTGIGKHGKLPRRVRALLLICR